MTEEILTSGNRYLNNLVDTWKEISRLAEEYRENEIMYNRVPPDLKDRYVAKLTRFWLELADKLEGRNEFGKFPEEYEEYRKFYINPKLLKESSDIYELEACIKKALEKLKITKYEK